MKKSLTRLNLFPKKALIRKIYIDLIKQKTGKYSNISDSNLNILISLCKKNNWNIIDYIKFQIQYCKSPFIKFNMLISPRAINLWKNKEKNNMPMYMQTSKGIKYNTLSQNEYLKTLLKKKHGDKVWIEEYFGEKAKDNLTKKYKEKMGDK